MSLPNPEHRLSDLNLETMRATCAVCGSVRLARKSTKKSRRGFYYVCGKAKDRRSLGYKRKRLFGVSPSEYNAMRERQNGLCAICNRPPTARGLAIDHCHVTGRVRGLLCGSCNLGLGYFKDDPATVEYALNYLKAHS